MKIICINFFEVVVKIAIHKSIRHSATRVEGNEKYIYIIINEEPFE